MPTYLQGEPQFRIEIVAILVGAMCRVDCVHQSDGQSLSAK